MCCIAHFSINGSKFCFVPTEPLQPGMSVGVMFEGQKDQEALVITSVKPSRYTGDVDVDVLRRSRGLGFTGTPRIVRKEE